MCYAGKCCYFMKVETGSMIFAVINMIINSILAIGIIAALVWYEIHYYQALHRTDYNIVNNVYQNTHEAARLYQLYIYRNIILGVSLMLSLIYFAFSVLLLNGLIKTKSGQVKVYFIFGVIINVLSYALIIYEPAVITVSVSYTLLLVMIYMTYNKMEANKYCGTVLDDCSVLVSA
ncbi:uncharacterized protein LOC131855201 [Achroia grisella]|uniref:uncharacterized protein LOC131844061 n=1 Tax=Achroia grisella TaxID=688607 RepID=UPI0027D3440A|nr:uncharacterized protein LOC131844061 [Achroia grisella]XP_059062431.1 uncharacterized protein LOC131855201 [Achroia grisella]